ncbi:MAG: cytochrome P450, partial [Actinomycetota bacterium]
RRRTAADEVPIFGEEQMTDQSAIDDQRRSRFPLGAQVRLAQLETDPYPVLAELRAAEPVSWVPALGAWLVTRRDLAVAAMRDAEAFTVDDPRFSTGAVLGPSMLSLDGPEHQRHRNPFAPSFRPGILREEFDHYLTAECHRLIDRFLADGMAELRTALAGPLAVNTIVRFLGLRDVTSAEVLDWYHHISDAITGLNLGTEPSVEQRAAIAAIHERVEATLADAGDTSVVARVAASGALRPDELGSAIAVLMFGAIETAEGMTANALWHLLTNPEVLAQVRADRHLVADAIEESVRLEPAAAVLDRYTTTDTRLGEVVIPERELVTLSLQAANRDPEVFDDPDRFDLQRPNTNRHVTFAQGPHGCLGIHLTRMETVAAVNALLDATDGRDLRLDPTASTAPTGLIFRKPERVVARW